MYAAYGCLDQLRFINAWCWAHVRRHIMRAAVSDSALSPWSSGWLEAIASMYAAWHARRAGDAGADAELRSVVAGMRKSLSLQLGDSELTTHKPAASALKMMATHWDGLVLFVEHPEIAPDNNAAERIVRSPVLGRKNYSGSGTPSAAELAASSFSLIATLAQWNLNPITYLSGYFSACAAAKGTAPTDLTPFLPWSASQADLAQWRSPP
jgi:transposase